jgi:hypothetical protein
VTFARTAGVSNQGPSEKAIPKRDDRRYMMSSILEFEVEVLDGEGISVPGIEVGARYRYPHSPHSWSEETTDCDGCAHFRDTHEETPADVVVFVHDEDCGAFDVASHPSLVIEM